ncbi:hypothetical protein J2I47_19295 [Fibrella sp. HMF5335]|uniref:cGAS/DncV-like nucleotidyltransferase C-terminal helical domain-containing protein n=1 Tax=Fibrella rubiginis TaxID=2817060 RepID=A0A939GJQ2_9BACT|nr:hypothetical protein [Fibrella rubiginis]MBO0938705.1 hypothetical protein [Fibrella rubiginis]
MASVKRKNYNQLLTNIRNRRTEYDSNGRLENSILTQSFEKADIPETIKYVYESMESVDNDYTKKTYEEAERVQSQITAGLISAKGVIQDVIYDYQGSVPTDTHIKIHSDLDILVIHDVFYHGVSLTSPFIPYTGDPIKEMKEMRTNIYNRLTSTFYKAKVRNDKAKAIQISGGSLKRKFDILVCSRYNTLEYVSSRQDHLRAIKLYDNELEDFQEDHPFYHIYKVNEKNNSLKVRGNLKRMIRLLKNIKADSNLNIEISSFLITSIMYNMDEQYYNVDNIRLHQLLVNASLHLTKILEQEAFRKSLISPNGKELLFTSKNQTVVLEIIKLKRELDITIADLADDFKEVYPFLDKQELQKGDILIENNANLNESYKVLNQAPYFYSLTY